jgi:outer membrane biosynthesis protein TonB
MTTAEFIISPSGGDAEDRKQEARKVFIAFLIAVVIHLLIGYSLAVYGGLLYSPFSVAEEEKPVELSFVDLSTPAPMKNTMFVQNDESKQTEAPKEKTFESNANSIAASQGPATEGLPVPTQDGKARPAFDLDSHPYTLSNEGAQPQPSAAAQQSITPQPTVQPTPISKADEFAMLTLPKPSVQPTAETKPQPPKSTYQPMKERTRSAGSITNRGISAVNAVGTPLGRYEKTVYDAIGSRWYAYMQQRGDYASLGTARVAFIIDRDGRVQSLKVVSNDSNESFVNVCLQSIMEIKLPPIPEDVASALPPGGLQEQIAFTMFPN